MTKISLHADHLHEMITHQGIISEEIDAVHHYHIIFKKEIKL